MNGTILPGTGGSGTYAGLYAGTGGGGYYGGGSGVAWFGGGGGNGFSGGLTGPLATESTLGGNSGHGYIVLSYTPITAPDAPAQVSAAAGDGQATVSWSAPASDGGSPITGYTVTASPGGATCSTTTALTCTVTGLTNGTSYTFAVTASNKKRASAASVASAPVIPKAPVPPPFVYTATGSVVVPAGSRATIMAQFTNATSIRWEYSTDGTATWAPVVPADPSDITVDSSSPSSSQAFYSFVMTEAVAGTSFRLVASNETATVASLPVKAVVAYRPAAPTNVTVTPVPGQAAVDVSWTTPPPAEGKYPVQGVDVLGSPAGSCSGSGPFTTCRVVNLTYGTTYTFKVSARNIFGSGAAATTTPVTLLRSWQSTPSAQISASASPLTTAGEVSASNLVDSTPASSALSWQWQRRASGSSDWADVAGASGTGVSVAPLSGGALVPGGSYRLAVSYQLSTYPDVTTYSNIVGPSLGLLDFGVATSTNTGGGVVRAGSPVSASVTGASASGVDYAYQWSVDDVAVSGATGSSFTPSADMVGKKLSVAVTGSKDYYVAKSVSVVAADVVAPALAAPVISQQPTDVLAMDERVAVFSVSASGVPAPSFGWEQSLDGGRSWSKVAGAQSATLGVTAAAKLNGALFRAVVSNEAGVVRSGSARLSVSRLLRAPASFKATPGDKRLTLSWVPSVGNKPLPVSSYIVRRLDAGGSGGSGGTSTECVVPASEPLVCVVEGLRNTQRYSFSVVAVNAAGEGRVATTAGTPFRPVVFTQQPESVTVAAGASFTLSTVVTADPVASLRWQVSGDGGRTWRNTGGVVAGTSTSLTERSTLARSGWRYRVKASQAVGGVSYSDAVTVSVVR